MENEKEQTVQIAFRDFEQLHRLIGSARKGDEQSRKQLREFLDRTRMWASAGDVAQRAIDQWIQTLAPENCPEIVEAVNAKLAQLWLTLGGPDGSSLEQLLIQRIQVCWLQTHYIDVAFAAAHRMQGMSDKFLQLSCERVEACQRSYLRAIRELAVVRRLQPVIIKARVAAATQNQPSEAHSDMSEAELAEVMTIQRGKERPEDFPPLADPDTLSTKLQVSKVAADDLELEDDNEVTWSQ